jgi:hypothetical protein
MADLAKEIHDQNRFFDALRINRIIVNPAVAGYPPLFLLCSEKRAGTHYDFAVGLNFEEFNTVLMKGAASKDRIPVAARLGETLIPTTRVQNSFLLKDVLGYPLQVLNLAIHTRVRKFVTEPPNSEDPLYYFKVRRVAQAE